MRIGYVVRGSARGLELLTVRDDSPVDSRDFGFFKCHFPRISRFLTGITKET